MNISIFNYKQDDAVYNSFVVIQSNHHPLFKLFDGLQGPLQDMGRSYADSVVEGYCNV